MNISQSLNRRQISEWICLSVLGLGLAKLMAAMGIPAAVILGPMAVAIVLGLRGSQIRMPAPAMGLCHAVAGCLIAVWLDPVMLRKAIGLWPLILCFVFLTFLAAGLTGLFAARRTGLDQRLTIWGFLPGMLGAVIEAAQSKGLDSRPIAFIQILRLLNVILAMVVLAAMLEAPAAPSAKIVTNIAENGEILHWTTLGLQNLQVFALAIIGALIARKLPFIPAGATLVPLIITAALSFSGHPIVVPGWIVSLAFLGIGAGVGLRFTPQMMRAALRAVPGLMLSCCVLIVLCALSGMLLAWIANVSVMTGILATVPGSIDSLAVLAIGTGADVSFIMAFQTVRLFAVAFLGPSLAEILNRAMPRRQS